MKRFASFIFLLFAPSIGFCLDLTPHTPFYLESWFFALVAGFVVLIVFFLYRLSSSVQSVTDNYSLLEQPLGINRLILLFFGFVYPIGTVVNTIIDTKLKTSQPELAIVIGVLSLGALAGSYRIRLLKRYIAMSVLLGYLLIMIHILTLILLNDASRVHVNAFILSVVFGSVLFGSLKKFYLFAVVVFCAMIGIAFMIDKEYAGKIQLVIVAFWTLLVAAMLIVVKLNLIQKLRLSDTILKKGDSIILVCDSKYKIIYASNSIEEKLGYALEDVYGEGWWMLREKYDNLKREDLIGYDDFKQGTKLYTNTITDSEGVKKYFSWTDTKIEGGLIIGVGQDITSTHLYQEEMNRLSLVAKNTDNYVVISDSDEIVLWVNSAFEEIFKFKSDEILGKKISSIFNTEELNPMLYKKVQKHVFEEKMPFRGQLTEMDANGNHLWLSVNITPILSEDGELEQLITVGSDITDNKLDEFQLNEYSKKLELMHEIDNILIEENTEMVMINDLLKVIKYSNSMYIKVSIMLFDDELKNCNNYFLDDNSTEISFETDLDLTAFGSLENLKSNKSYLVNDLEASASSASDMQLLQEGIKSYLMVPLVVGDRILGTLNVGGSMPFIFVDDEISLIEEIADSVTVSYKQRDQASKIMESEENFRQLNESLKEVFWFFDQENSKMLYLSKAFNTIFGIPQEKMFENPMIWMESVIAEDRVRIQRTYLAEIFADGFDEQFQIIHPEVGIKWVHATSVPIRNADGEVVRISGFVEDITELKNKEEELGKLNTKLESINNINESILGNEPFGKVLLSSLKRLGFVQSEIHQLSIFLFNFEKNEFVRFMIDNQLISFNRSSERFSIDSIVQLDKLRSGKTNVLDREDLIDYAESGIPFSENDLIQHIVQVPLIFDRELIGTLNLGLSEGEDLNEAFLRGLEDIAKGMSLSIHQMQLKAVIESDKEELTSKNRDITASINYASRIQKAHLPDIQVIRENFADAQLYYVAKDIVSGDFYWWDIKDEKLIIVVADCTGHGVPGGFMTILGAQTIDKIVHNLGITNPGLLLHKLDEEIQLVLGDSQDTMGDGMDVAVCAYDLNEQTIEYAGARRPIVFLKDGKLQELKGTFRSIGEHELEHVDFVTHEIVLDKGDRFFLFSDGAQDQFGGPDRPRKFSKKRMQDLIQNKEYLKVTLDEHFDVIINSLNEWKGERELTDDITILAIEN